VRHATPHTTEGGGTREGLRCGLRPPPTSAVFDCFTNTLEGFPKDLVSRARCTHIQGVMPTTATLPRQHAPTQAARAAREQEQAPSARRTSHDRGTSLEVRTTVLEARWEETIPRLATKADISDLRGEMRGLENRLIKWVIGAALALVAVFTALFTYMGTQMSSALADQAARMEGALTAQATRMDNALADQAARTDTAIGSLETRLDNSITSLETRIDNSITSLATRMDNAIAELKAENRAMNVRIDRLDARIDRLDEKIDARFDALMAEIRAQGQRQ